MPRLIVVLCFILFSVQHVFGQREIIDQGLYWIKYQAKYKTTRDWTLGASVEDRRYFQRNRQHMWLIEGFASRPINAQFESGVGFVKWSIVMPSDPSSEFEVKQHELRPFIFLNHKYSLSKILTWHNRLNYEQRFRQNVTTSVVGKPIIESGYYTYGRLRIRTQLKARVNRQDASIPFFVTLSDEYMIHWGAEEVPWLFDQNRVGLFFSADITPHLNLMSGYTHWYQKTGAERYFSRNILMCYVTQSF